MKILMIVPGGVHRSGRIQVIPALLAFLERLAARHELTVITLRQYPDFRRYHLVQAVVINLGHRTYLPGSINVFLRGYRLRQMFHEKPEKYDLIHAFWLTEPGLLGWITGNRLKIPLVASLGGGEMTRLPQIKYGASRYWPNRAIIRKVLRSAAAVTAGSRYALDTVRKQRSDAIRVPLFPEVKTFLELPEAREGPPWRLLHVASINKTKDPPTLLKALKCVVERYGETILDWVGEDTLGGSVQRIAERMGLGGNIRFHGGITYDALPEFYRKAHVYVQSSLHESQGVAVCEAAAAGVPVAGTDVGLVHELAPDKAVAVPVGDGDALGKAILELLSDPPGRLAMGKRTRAWAGIHTADWTLERFESIYENLISRMDQNPEGENKSVRTGDTAG